MRQLALHPRKERGSERPEQLQWAMVDDEDYEELVRYTWYFKVDNAGDPRRRHISVGRRSTSSDSRHLPDSLVLLNRHILHIDDPRITVHFKDGDPLNCQKENLEVTLDGWQLAQLFNHWMQQLEIRADIVHKR